MSQRSMKWIICTAVVVLAAGTIANAEEWGTLTGKFVLDGKAPEAASLKDTNKDGCDKHKLLDETITVGEGNALAGVFVYLRTKNPAIAPSYKDSEKAEIVLDNHNCRFEPHTMVMRAGQKLMVKNSDPFGHNSNIATFKNPPANPLVPSGASVPQEFKDEEALPTKVGCNIHPWMGAWVLIRKDPYATVSDKTGTFTIKDLPAGKELEFQVWHEGGGNVKDISFKGGKADSKGRFKLTIKPGENDLGEIKIPLSVIKK